MMTKDTEQKREQVQIVCMDDLVPQNHLLRLLIKPLTGVLFMTLWRTSTPLILVDLVWTLLFSSKSLLSSTFMASEACARP